MSLYLKILIFFMSMFVIGCTSLFFILNYMSPYSFGNSAIFLFYFTIFIIIFSLFSGTGMVVRFLLANKTDLKNFVNSSGRQAGLIGIMTCVSLLLLHKSFFSINNLIIIILIGLVIEALYYIFKKI